MYEFHEMERNPGFIRLATESEACARYTMRAALERDAQRTHLRRGDCVIVVDGGGGTVDLASYRIDTLTPEFQVTQIGEPMGKYCSGDSFNLKEKMLTCSDRRALRLNQDRRLLSPCILEAASRREGPQGADGQWRPWRRPSRRLFYSSKLCFERVPDDQTCL
jgi:hypothetical protein